MLRNKRMKSAKQHREEVNKKKHRYIFSPYTSCSTISISPRSDDDDEDDEDKEELEVANVNEVDPHLDVPKPREIKNYLDQYIIGQEEAKISLSVAISNHYNRINLNMDGDDIRINKSNILMIGKSGSGKTLLVETIARRLNVPFVAIDATTVTPTGIVGKEPSEIIRALEEATKPNQKTEHGIVFIDEIDKLAYNMSASLKVRGSSMGTSTQHALLKIIEGGDVETSRRMSMISGSVGNYVNTRDILFICAGAFDGIEMLREDEELHNVGADEVIRYGLVPELVGRLPVILKLDPLRKRDLVSILTEPEDSIIKQYQRLLNLYNVDLTFSDEALEQIADLAIETNVGARGLRGVLDNIVSKIIYNIPEDDAKRKCIVVGDGHIILE